VLLNQLEGLVQSHRSKSIVSRDGHGGIKPELCLAIGVIYVYVRPEFLTREEEESKAAHTQNSRAHSIG
jgi:hypothetical protein